MNDFSQGDIVKIVGFRSSFLVVSKNAFIRAAHMFHVCPLLSNNLIRLPLKPAINIDIGIEAIDLKDLTPVANEFYSMLRHSYQTHQ